MRDTPVAAVNDKPQHIGEFFDEQGYYLAKSVFSPDSVRALERDFDRIVQQLEASGEDIDARWESEYTDELDGGASRIIHTHNVQRYSAAWLAALQDPRFLDIAEGLLGPDIILHHSKLFQKPPREGAPFPVHQDWSYFPTRHDSMIAAIIFLSDADAESGGLCVFPGSHKLGRMDNSAGRSVGDSESASLNSSAELAAKYPLEGGLAINAKPGDVVFFSYLTLHGSTPDRSDKNRKTVLVQLYGGNDHVIEDGGDNHVNERLVLRGWNHQMQRGEAGS